ncbi:uncharacterized protein TNCV_1820501 [Trichonephila clavipes]|nr:uncharacterized protein TNCV_1820501 [Trichonephila clavipes]
MTHASRSKNLGSVAHDRSYDRFLEQNLVPDRKITPSGDKPFKVLEVRNNNLIILKEGKRVTVNIDQVRVYRPRQSDTISSDSHVETLYEGQRSSNGSSRSHPGKFKACRKTSSEESKGRESNKGNARWEDPRLKRKVGSNGSVDRKDIKRSKICRKRSLQVSEHRDQKRPTPELIQVHCRFLTSNGYQAGQATYRREQARKSGQYDKARETRTTTSGTNRAAERRPVQSKQAIAVVDHCPYYLRSRVKQPEGIPEEHRNRQYPASRTTSREGASVWKP